MEMVFVNVIEARRSRRRRFSSLRHARPPPRRAGSASIIVSLRLSGALPIKDDVSAASVPLSGSNFVSPGVNTVPDVEPLDGAGLSGAWRNRGAT